MFLLKGRVEFNGAYFEFQNKGSLENIIDDETNEDLFVRDHTWSDDPASCRIRRVSLIKYARRQSQRVNSSPSSLRRSTNHGKSMVYMMTTFFKLYICKNIGVISILSDFLRDSSSKKINNSPY